MNQKSVKIGFVQRKVNNNNLEENLKQFIEDATQLAAQGAQVICTQELFLGRYFCYEEKQSYFDLAIDVEKSFLIKELEVLAEKLGVVLITSHFEKRAKGLYHNTAVVFDENGVNLGKYRKMHIPDDPGFYEKYYFTPGDLGYKVFETKFGNLGVLICWDQWYPEAARLTAMQGADILFYPTAIGWEIGDTELNKQEQLGAWQTMQKSHAVANGVYVVAINRTGREEETDFWGSSFVANPMGRIVYESPVSQEDMAVCELDLTKAEEYRRTWPFFRDRRIDSYEEITERFLK